MRASSRRRRRSRPVRLPHRAAWCMRSGEKHLVPFPASTAAVTTELAVSGPVQYLAVWRLLPAAIAEDDPVWELIRRAAAPRPRLSLRAGLLSGPGGGAAHRRAADRGAARPHADPRRSRGAHPAARSGRSPVRRPRRSLSPPAALSVGRGEPLPDAVSPILVGRREAWGLAHFIYMAIEAREIHDLRPVDLQLQPGQEDLIFLPAVWDPRCIHESNWQTPAPGVRRSGSVETTRGAGAHPKKGDDRGWDRRSHRGEQELVRAAGGAHARLQGLQGEGAAPGGRQDPAAVRGRAPGFGPGASSTTSSSTWSTGAIWTSWAPSTSPGASCGPSPTRSATPTTATPACSTPTRWTSPSSTSSISSTTGW